MATESTSILRHRRNGGATAIPWSTLQDPNLSFTARGVLAYCLSLPEGWAFSAKRIAASTSHQGQQAVLTALKQLEKAGYRKVTTERGERGRFRKIVEFSYVPVPEWIQDDNQDEQTFPQVAPKLGKPRLGKPRLGGPGKTDVSAGRTEARETEAREPETLRGVNPEGYTHTVREDSVESSAGVEVGAATSVCVEADLDEAFSAVVTAVDVAARPRVAPHATEVRTACSRALTAGHSVRAIVAAVAGATDARTRTPGRIAATNITALAATAPAATTGSTPTVRPVTARDCPDCGARVTGAQCRECLIDARIRAMGATA